MAASGAAATSAGAPVTDPAGVGSRITFRMITMRAVARCPRLSLLPSHYRHDGSCYCSGPARGDVPFDVIVAAAGG